MGEMKLIMERWDAYLLKEDPANIRTIGELHGYFAEKEPGKLKKLAAKYGGITAKVLGMGAGAAVDVATGGMTGGTGTKAGVAIGAAASSQISEKVVEALLTAAVTSFANLEDGTYPAGTAASYFDLEDHLTMFMRHLQTQGADVVKPSVPELQVFEKMKERIEDAVKSGIDPDKPLAELLGQVTSQAVMDQELETGEHSGKVKVEPVT